MADLFGHTVQALVRHLGADSAREVLHAAIDSLVDDAANEVAPKPRRTGQRPPATINNVAVDDLAAAKAQRALQKARLL